MGSSTTWSRRSMLVASASAAAAAALAGPLGSAASAATAPRAARAVTGLRREHWTPLVGKLVSVAGPAGAVRARVLEVGDLRGAAGDAARFSVELRADARQPSIAGLRPITIPGRGVSTLLVSAVDRDVEQSRFFQIVVNSPKA